VTYHRIVPTTGRPFFVRSLVGRNVAGLGLIYTAVKVNREGDDLHENLGQTHVVVMAMRPTSSRRSPTTRSASSTAGWCQQTKPGRGSNDMHEWQCRATVQWVRNDAPRLSVTSRHLSEPLLL
jgi:hypothetical protein